MLKNVHKLLDYLNGYDINVNEIKDIARICCIDIEDKIYNEGRLKILKFNNSVWKKEMKKNLKKYMISILTSI